ncbi:MAG: pyruvate kinase [Coprobacter sp.]|nr:pyruvate kinase [Coprobacter sp.]
MSKHTKIVATVSDKRCDTEFVRALFDNGMNVVRMNSAHLDADGFNKIIRNVRSVSNTIALLMDTKGPEMRTTAIADDGRVHFFPGDRVKMTGNPDELTTRQCISISYPQFVQDLTTESRILVDDGEIEFTVLEKHSDYLLCEAQNEGELGSRKSVNVPGVRINLPSLTEKDKRNILFAIGHNIDFIAHSFVRNKQDVLDVQAILKEHNSDIKVIAKIENQDGVDNIDEILEAAYGVMIARGDLGIEVPQEKIPGIQRILIKKCIQAQKPVIVATQMLHSMINNPRPTRAEVTDIANAIYYRTDALMLSGETAYGKYPVEAIATMSRVAEEAEKTKLSDNDIRVIIPDSELDVTSFLAKQAVKSSVKLGTKAIITDSYSGRTARSVAAYRGKYPVLAICYKERTMRELALSYGVFSMYQEETKTSREYLYNGLNLLINRGWLTRNDLITYIGGAFGEGSGSTFLEINRVDKVLSHYHRYVLPNLEETDR